MSLHVFDHLYVYILCAHETGFTVQCGEITVRYKLPIQFFVQTCRFKSKQLLLFTSYTFAYFNVLLMGYSERKNIIAIIFKKLFHIVILLD